MKQALIEIAKMVRAVNGDRGEIVSEVEVYDLANAGLNGGRGTIAQRDALRHIVELAKPAVEGSGSFPESDVLSAVEGVLSFNNPSVTAAERAIAAHQASLGIDGDDSIQVWHLLESLHEYCAARGIDLDEELASVKEHIASDATPS